MRARGCWVSLLWRNKGLSAAAREIKIVPSRLYDITVYLCSVTCRVYQYVFFASDSPKNFRSYFIFVSVIKYIDITIN